MKIQSIKAREILDSRGNPTVEVDLTTDDGVFRSSVPSGSSTGTHEAFELRDTKDQERYSGKGVLMAVKNVNDVIAPKLEGMNVLGQEKIDKFMIDLDGTENKSKLGANAILGVSLSVCRAAAASKEVNVYEYISTLSGSKASMPKPCFNIINGGSHAGNGLDIQEFMIVPQSERFCENLEAGVEVYNALKEILKKEYGEEAVNLGDEGGFAPPIETATRALDLIQMAFEKSNHTDVKIALDIASSSSEKSHDFDFYLKLIEKYPIIILEDPFSEDDWDNFQDITQKLGKEIIIIGDDLLVTNPQRIEKAQEKKACNGLLLKLNQIGSVTEAINAFNLAKSSNWKVMVSHRSGDTADNFISDLAVGLGADFIKSGAPARGERVAKYNQLLRIEENFK
ncbi:MAG: phosphopyruvate hydratase [Patescibacteria group bacterium]